MHSDVPVAVAVAVAVDVAVAVADFMGVTPSNLFRTDTHGPVRGASGDLTSIGDGDGDGNGDGNDADLLR